MVIIFVVILPGRIWSTLFDGEKIIEFVINDIIKKSGIKSFYLSSFGETLMVSYCVDYQNYY